MHCCTSSSEQVARCDCVGACTPGRVARPRHCVRLSCSLRARAHWRRDATKITVLRRCTRWLPLNGSRQRHCSVRLDTAANTWRRLLAMEASSTDGVQTFQLDLPLQCGRVLRGATVAYETRGDISAAKDNVILHPTSFDATSSDLMYNVGPGKMLDTDKYHGVCQHRSAHLLVQNFHVVGGAQ